MRAPQLARSSERFLARRRTSARRRMNHDRMFEGKNAGRDHGGLRAVAEGAVEHGHESRSHSAGGQRSARGRGVGIRVAGAPDSPPAGPKPKDAPPMPARPPPEQGQGKYRGPAGAACLPWARPRWGCGPLRGGSKPNVVRRPGTRSTHRRASAATEAPFQAGIVRRSVRSSARSRSVRRLR